MALETPSLQGCGSFAPPSACGPSSVITAWWKAWGRRNIVESANAAFHGEFVDIGRNYTRFLKTAKIKLFLAHTIAGYNRRTVHQWLRLQKLVVDRAPVKTRRKARTGRRRRYEDLPTTPADTSSDP